MKVQSELARTSLLLRQKRTNTIIQGEDQCLAYRYGSRTWEKLGEEFDLVNIRVLHF